LYQQNYLAYLEENGISFELTPDQTQAILDCPECGSTKHTYFNVTNGLWDCKKCKAKGNFYQFKDAYKHPAIEPENSVREISVDDVERYQSALFLSKNNATLEYLTKKRCYSIDEIKASRLGVNDFGDIVIPYYNEKDELYGCQVKNIHTGGWYSIGKPGIYNIQILKDNPDELVVFEGAWDVIAARQYGLKKAISIPGANWRKDSWVLKLKEIQKIYICLDTDEVGTKGARELASRLGLNRCWNVKLPLKDINDCLIAKLPVGIVKKAIQDAEQFPVPGMCSSDRFIDDVMDSIENPNKLKGYPTHYPKLDIMTGGFGPGEIRVVSGLTSVGKTTFLMDEMLQYAKQNIPVAIFCLESAIHKVMKEMLQSLSNRPLSDMTKEEIVALVKQLSEMPIHWFDEREFEGNLNVMKVKELIRQTRDRYGVKFVVIDNLQFVLNTDYSKRSTDEKVTSLMTELKLLAKTLQIHIIAVAHINRQNDGDRPQMQQLKGSSAYEQTSDYIMFVHRDTNPDADPEIKARVEVIVAKNRPNRETGIIQFRYDKEKCLYREE